MALGAEQVRTLRVIVDRLVPADDFPSAGEAGVVGFLENLICAEGLEESYAAGLDSLDRESREIFDQGFGELSPDQQDALLSEIERGRVASEWSTNPARFFGLLAQQTIEGYYADPGNGGNRDGIAWKMIGYRVTA